MQHSRASTVAAVVAGAIIAGAAMRLSPGADPALQTAGLQQGMPPAAPGLRGGMPPGIAELSPEQRAMMMMAMAGGSTMAVGQDGSVYVLRGSTLYKYSPDLKLLTTATLPTPAPPSPSKPARGR